MTGFDLIEIILIVLAMFGLLLAQGFFSGSEIAMVHADRLKLHHLANQGNRSAKLCIRFFHKPEVLLGTTLVGTNISLVSLTTLGTLLMIRIFGEHGDLYAFLIYTPLFLILGEVVPKSVYQQKADSFVLTIIHPLRFFSWLFYPVVFIFSWVARKVAQYTGVEVSSRDLYTHREQIRTVIEMAEQGADIDVFDRDRIIRVTRFAEATVGQAMIPFGEVTVLSKNASTQEAIRLAHDQGHFRLPVYEVDRNQIIGVVSFTMWDLMDPNLSLRPLTELIQPVYFTTANQLLDELLPQLQQRKDHMAIIIDEFGNAIGMITQEDILEEVVGEVIDVGYTFDSKLDRHKYRIKIISDGEYELNGRTPIHTVCDRLGISQPETEAHTIGGLLTSHLRHIPKEGESIVRYGYRFVVEKMTDGAIEKLHVVKTA